MNKNMITADYNDISHWRVQIGDQHYYVKNQELEKYSPDNSVTAQNPQSKEIKNQRIRSAIDKENASLIIQQRVDHYQNKRFKQLAILIAYEKSERYKKEFEADVDANERLQKRRQYIQKEPTTEGNSTETIVSFESILQNLLDTLYKNQRLSITGEMVNVDAKVKRDDSLLDLYQSNQNSDSDTPTPRFLSGDFTGEGSLEGYKIELTQKGQTLGSAHLVRQGNNACSITADPEYRIQLNSEEPWSNEKVDHLARIFEIQKVINLDNDLSHSPIIDCGKIRPDQVTKATKVGFYNAYMKASWDNFCVVNREHPVHCQFTEDDGKKHSYQLKQNPNSVDIDPQYISVMDSYRKDPTLIKNSFEGSKCPLSQQVVVTQSGIENGVVLGSDGYLYKGSDLESYLTQNTHSPPKLGQSGERLPMANGDFLSHKETSQLLQELKGLDKTTIDNDGISQEGSQTNTMSKQQITQPSTDKVVRGNDQKTKKEIPYTIDASLSGAENLQTNASNTTLTERVEASDPAPSIETFFSPTPSSEKASNSNQSELGSKLATPRPIWAAKFSSPFNEGAKSFSRLFTGANDDKSTWWSWLSFSSLSVSIFAKAKPKTNENTTEEDKKNPAQNW